VSAAIAAVVFILFTWFGALVSCTNRNSCTTNQCSPCDQLNWLGYGGLAAVAIIAIAGRTKRWTAPVMVVTAAAVVVALVLSS
jgi:hypothetical protein